MNSSAKMIATAEPVQYIPGLKSKLLMPELPKRAFRSKRIKGLPIPGKRAAIITAPGGFGKTTAVLLSLEAERQNLRWYRLEKEDALLPVFYANLIETLFAGIERNTLDCHRGLCSVGNISREYPLLNALICQDAWQYYSDKHSYHYIVFDDFQNVVDNPVITETIRYFIANMPPGIGIVVMSRVETGICTGRLTLSDSVKLIGKDDLRFTREETEKLLVDIYKIKFTTAELDRIHEYVEGWIAALFLISRIDNPLQLLFDVPPEADHTTELNLFNLFFSEFLQGIDQSRLQALAEMSIFSDFSGDELTEILQIKNPFELLDWLEKSNIYIQKFKTRPVRYRFHSLFRRELEIYLKKTGTDHYIRNLLARAACYYEAKGDMRPAVSYHIAAGQVEKAVRIMSVSGAELFARGEPEKIMYLVEEFPENAVQSDPYLLFYRGLVLRTDDVKEAYNCFRTALIMFRERNDMTYLMNTFGMILVMAFEINDFKYVEDVVSFIPKLKVLFSSAIPRQKLLISGFINTVADEKFKTGMLFCRLIDRLKIPEPIWDYSYSMLRGILLYRTGRLNAAYKSLPKILNHRVGLSSDQWRFIGLVACHNTLWLRRDIEASKKIRDEFAELGEKYGSDFFRSFAFRLSAIIKFQTRDTIGAISDMRETAGAYVRYGSPILAGAAMITSYLWETEIAPAQTLPERAEHEFLNIPQQNAGHGYYELCQGMMGAIYKAAGEYDKAEAFLISAYNESKKKKARQHMCAMAMHLSDLYYRKNNRKQFLKFLNFWANQSSIQKYVFFHEMDYHTLVRACALALENGLCPEHMIEIIRLYFGPEHGKRIAQNPTFASADPGEFISGCVEPAKKQQAIKVTLFGNFSIQTDGLLLGEKDWKTRKICGILVYVLSKPDRRVTRELLASIFWPDSDAKAANTSLRVALYELRKILARFGMGFKDEAALIVEDKNGFHIGSGNLITTDVQEFQELYDQYKSQELTGAQAEDLLAQMTRLYTGDFLAENYFDDEWVYLAREFYKSIFIEASQALSRIYIQRGALKEAETLLEKHMAIDPFCEKGCGLLVDIYKSTGQTARADSFIRQFRKRFEVEMGEKPEGV